MVKNKNTVKKFNVKEIATVDHSYGTDTCAQPDLSEEFLNAEKSKILSILNSNHFNRAEILNNTVDQFNCNEWLEIRRIMLTASNFGKICRRKKDFGKLVSQIKATSNMVPTAAMKHGIIYESVALERLERELNLKVEKCGLFIDDDHEYLGCSPDGLVGDKGIVEVKCPYNSFNLNIDEQIIKRKITCFNVDRKTKKITGVNKNHHYWYQIQGQLHITKRDFCFFVLYAGENEPIKVEKIKRDKEFFQSKMLSPLNLFYFNHFLLELADSRLSRGMQPR